MNMNCGPLSCVIKLSQLPAATAMAAVGRNNSRLSAVFLSRNYYFYLANNSLSYCYSTRGITGNCSRQDKHCGGCERASCMKKGSTVYVGTFKGRALGKYFPMYHHHHLSRILCMVLLLLHWLTDRHWCVMATQKDRVRKALSHSVEFCNIPRSLRW